jgi:hypothetical protein
MTSSPETTTLPYHVGSLKRCADFDTGRAVSVMLVKGAVSRTGWMKVFTDSVEIFLNSKGRQLLVVSTVSFV